jgi:hypothetical protein
LWHEEGGVEVIAFGVVIELDASGRPLKAYIEEARSPETDACVLQEVREWTFAPAMDCSGTPIPGTYREVVVAVGCWVGTAATNAADDGGGRASGCS